MVVYEGNCRLAWPETWLNVDTDEEPQLPGYVFKHNPRGNCYDDSEPAFAALKQQQRGGVGVYCSENIDVQVSIPERCNLECLYFEIPHANLTAAVLYRPSSYKIDMFREQLLQVIFELEKHPGRKLIMGDFNEDIFVSSTILKLLEQHGYNQHVQAATTEKDNTGQRPSLHLAATPLFLGKGQDLQGHSVWWSCHQYQGI
ncbi:uncharacterized protein LOC121695246 [Alosa sapidissima]|uniref:uncharacterized protein LOC121695246 n=1 Tax=Alosa sapidissima TaxID=34773 RepID=UPI001C084DA4|nr:uncharacterized protein LOC121695246 [Alosa sapidissima]